MRLLRAPPVSSVTCGCPCCCDATLFRQPSRVMMMFRFDLRHRHGPIMSARQKLAHNAACRALSRCAYFDCLFLAGNDRGPRRMYIPRVCRASGLRARHRMDGAGSEGAGRSALRALHGRRPDRRAARHHRRGDEGALLYYVQPDGKAMRYGVAVGRREPIGWTGDGVHRPQGGMAGLEPAGRDESRWPHVQFTHRAARTTRSAPAPSISTRATRTRSTASTAPTSRRRSAGRVSSGCIRMRNIDVIDLYNRVPASTKVIVR